MIAAERTVPSRYRREGVPPAAASCEDHLPLPPGLHPPVWQDWADTPHEALVRYLCTGMAVAERTLGRLPEPGDYEPSDSTEGGVMAAHTCHARGCTVVVPPRRFMCKAHWYRLPKPMRDRVWTVYRPGQEVTKDPSPEYLTVAQAAIDWLARKEASDA